jgi:hypothetical protein
VAGGGVRLRFLHDPHPNADVIAFPSDTVCRVIAFIRIQPNARWSLAVPSPACGRGACVVAAEYGRKKYLQPEQRSLPEA